MLAFCWTMVFDKSSTLNFQWTHAFFLMVPVTVTVTVSVLFLMILIYSCGVWRMFITFSCTVHHKIGLRLLPWFIWSRLGYAINSEITAKELQVWFLFLLQFHFIGMQSWKSTELSHAIKEVFQLMESLPEWFLMVISHKHECFFNSHERESIKEEISFNCAKITV